MKLKKNILEKILLADLDNQYLKLMGLMREFQNMFYIYFLFADFCVTKFSGSIL